MRSTGNPTGAKEEIVMQPSDPKQKAIVLQNSLGHAVNLVLAKVQRGELEKIETKDVMAVAKHLAEFVMKESGL